MSLVRQTWLNHEPPTTWSVHGASSFSTLFDTMPLPCVSPLNVDTGGKRWQILLSSTHASQKVARSLYGSWTHHLAHDLASRRPNVRHCWRGNGPRPSRRGCARRGRIILLVADRMPISHDCRDGRDQPSLRLQMGPAISGAGRRGIGRQAWPWPPEQPALTGHGRGRTPSPRLWPVAWLSPRGHCPQGTPLLLAQCRGRGASLGAAGQPSGAPHQGAGSSKSLLGVFVIPEVCNALSGTGEVGIPDHVKSIILPWARVIRKESPQSHCNFFFECLPVHVWHMPSRVKKPWLDDGMSRLWACMARHPWVARGRGARTSGTCVPA